ncbi:MAG: hypothetical protein ABI432_18760 [Flavobacteriales bacterium]
MDPIALKRSVLTAAGTRLQNTAAELQERINDLKAVTIGDDNAESASQTESTRGSDVELMNSLGEQHEHVLRDADQLSTIDPSVRMDRVQYGAVVHTDRRNFLVATSLEEFDAGGKHYLGVTPKAPLIQTLLGKQAGEQATFNGITTTIQDIL